MTMTKLELAHVLGEAYHGVMEADGKKFVETQSVKLTVSLSGSAYIVTVREANEVKK